jgi:hypothetical protein
VAKTGQCGVRSNVAAFVMLEAISQDGKNLVLDVHHAANSVSHLEKLQVLVTAIASQYFDCTS